MKNSTNTDIEPRGLNTAAAATYLGLSASYLEKARLSQTNIPGPAFKKIGKRVVYLKDSLDKFLESSD